MFEVEGNTTLRIEIEPGVYGLKRESAIGKTALYSIIKNMEAGGVPVLGYTYSDFMGIRPFHVREGTKVVILDRYDLYYQSDEIAAEAMRAAKNGAVVLLAQNSARVKMGGPLIVDGTADVLLKRDSVEVVI